MHVFLNDRNKSPVVIVNKYIINSKLSTLQIMKFGKKKKLLLFETVPSCLKPNLCLSTI